MNDEVWLTPFRFYDYYFFFHYFFHFQMKGVQPQGLSKYAPVKNTTTTGHRLRICNLGYHFKIHKFNQFFKIRFCTSLVTRTFT